MSLNGKKILLGITGSIAAYKSITLVRLLVKEGAEVKVVITPSARDFVSSLTLSTLSRNPVVSDLFDGQSWSNHVMLGRWADLMLVAPASCNSIARMAQGLCDNMLLATYLSATCPVWLAPAMDEDMWHHPATKANLQGLQSYGNRILPVGTGDLASGLVGDGRMAEPEDMLQMIRSHFQSTQSLKGRKALVTAGPTYEAIDPVRFIGNHSSGKMGVALAAELQRRGAEVTLVLGPSTVPVPAALHKLIRVTSAEEMYEACAGVFPQMDIAVMAAAVADYRPASIAGEKIKKKEQELELTLTRTRDILGSLGSQKRKEQVLVGFALETNNEEAHAREKLEKKNADMIVLNSLRDSGAGFGHDTNKVTLMLRNGETKTFETKSKTEVAADIIDTLTANLL
ncbi:MAG: bifunctional phosphopantothenoylcysteine decarboxylase/phosphopantothenate--cysteine ligase CoaBC [Chitinophagaceae bacterium]|nr:bifunctional phosphopantothenoylcysteine decarboxylase/phosphopantothenate--cysteine ligase CoaBC [Chitinophagaceae bacterium]